MSSPHNAVLTGFTPVQLAKPVPQALTLELSAYAFTRAYCIKNGVGLDDEAGFAKVYQSVKEKFDKYALSSTQIKRRQLIFFPKVSDIHFANGHVDIAAPEHAYLKLYDMATDPRGSDLKVRHESYAKVVDQGLERMFQDSAEAPDDLIHVTCSGYLAPSPVERMAADRGWFETTVTHSYHMGCYGAFPAIKMAHGMLSSSRFGITPVKHRVDIVHTELLSAHNNIVDARAENIITMTLFADGLIKYSVLSEEELHRQGGHGLRVLAMNEHLLPDSADEMTWVPGSHQFLMTLTPMVPVVIKRHVRDFVVKLLERAGIDFERERLELTFAIHPGGPKIVEHIQEDLGLSDEQVAVSKSVFLENGNMSSATIPHILKQVLEEVDVGTRVLCLGFGPGLTVTGMVLEKI
ncbi:type III polyketide synthase [Azorhizophilus paspali]|uniref:Type III polyketide synthase n=1 Tax=Azorhizophilus paspali TaxID=69963 RepID=A0ABV6SLQ5_AZOPA